MSEQCGPKESEALECGYQVGFADGKREGRRLERMLEHYWAVKIGRHAPYFALTNDCKQPALFSSYKAARQYKYDILSYCGHKDVFVIRVVLQKE